MKKLKYTLPKKFKTDWIKALRSGNYKQGSGALASEHEYTTKTSYCCLGVACDVAGEDIAQFIDEEWITNDYVANAFTLVPTELHGEGEDNILVEKLSMMNDAKDKYQLHEHNFLDIAEWIETNVKGV